MEVPNWLIIDIVCSDLLNIEVDPRKTGFFRMHLRLNSVAYPIVYSLTTPANQPLPQDNISPIPAIHQIPKDSDGKMIVNRLFDNILEGKIHKSPMIRKDIPERGSTGGVIADSGDIEYVSCIMKGIEVSGLLTWLDNLIQIRKDMLKK